MFVRWMLSSKVVVFAGGCGALALSIATVPPGEKGENAVSELSEPTLKNVRQSATRAELEEILRLRTASGRPVWDGVPPAEEVCSDLKLNRSQVALTEGELGKLQRRIDEMNADLAVIDAEARAKLEAMPLPQDSETGSVFCVRGDGPQGSAGADEVARQILAVPLAYRTAARTELRAFFDERDSRDQ